MKLKVGIIGATGYTGRELLRILARHPQAQVSVATSENQAGKKLSIVHAELRGGILSQLVLQACDVQKIANQVDVVFLCLPHAESAAKAKSFLQKGVKVIDLSADFRLKSAETYQQWYGPHPCPELLKTAVYGLPERYRAKIRKAKLVANPGCYATASILASLPLVEKNRVEKNSLVIDAKSGTSGAGKKVEGRYLFCEVNENFLPYAVKGHRHRPEIEQELQFAATTKNPITASFVPHLLPIERGILASVYATLTTKTSAAELREAYEQYYKNEPFVQILPEGVFPEIASVAHSNFCHIGVHVEERTQRAMIFSAIDNLGKGAASQAVQNLNLVAGWEETLALI